jgi:hypothetical protein
MEEVICRGFDYTYIRKLVGKVRNEIVIEIDAHKSNHASPSLARTTA